ncbi:MAG: diaminopimelate decarboxylase [Caldilineaceae bacterium]
MNPLLPQRLALFPHTVEVVGEGAAAHLTIGGCNLADLAEQYGTPLYVFDAATLDASAQSYADALHANYPADAGITYAGKAFLNRAVAAWAYRRGLWVDCTGVGEIAVAVAAGVPRAQLLVHGVNKSAEDLAAAVEHAGVVVVDNLSELQRLAALSAQAKQAPAIWLRVRPGVAVDTHAYRQTGQSDSKFGMDPQQTLDAVLYCQAHGLNLTGIHFHQGSHFHDPAPIGPALATVLDLIEEVHGQSGWAPQVLSPGGGWGVAYHEDDLPHPTIEEYVAFVAHELAEGCRSRGLPLPRLQVEPGRSIVARAGVAIYRVGAVKCTPNRRWLLLDGGMADNPRPALYGARYSALPVAAPGRPLAGPAWLAGPFCESGDVLIEGLPLPAIEEGELIAIPVSGAYHLAMGSNYNGARKPAVLWLRDGKAQLIQRRETLADLLLRDVELAE